MQKPYRSCVADRPDSEQASSTDCVHALIAADTVVNPIGRFLSAADTAPRVVPRFAPFNQVHQVLSDPLHGCWKPKPDLLIVWSTPERAIASFRALLEYEPADVDGILAEVDAFADLVVACAARLRDVFVLSWTVGPYRRWVQTMALRPGGLANVLMRMNLRLAERMAGCPNAYLLDTQHWYAHVQGSTFDPKLQALAKIEYSRDFFLCAAREIRSVLRGLRGQSRKLVICDLDNTLWGGVVGDDGIDGVRLGGHDGGGESFVQFQRELRGLKNRGILLAVCSKNDPGIAREMIDRHSAMVLRSSDFAALRTNWDDKAENVGAILDELNLLPQAAVFLDDHPAERERVRQAFPDLFVPEMPEDPAAYPSFLASLDCFETPAITPEDHARTDLYRQELNRRDAGASVRSIEAWLLSLSISMTARPLNRENLVRATQLLNKTNQFNMATRRLSQEEFWAWSQEQDKEALVFWVCDRFGDAGLVGIVTAAVRGEEARLVDFVMSCRVMGKGIEDALLHVMARRLAERRKIKSLRAQYLATPRNGPIWTFLQPKLSSPDEQVLDWAAIAVPRHVRIVNTEELVCQ